MSKKAPHPAQAQLENDIAKAMVSYYDFVRLFNENPITELKATLTSEGPGKFKFSIEHDIPQK